MSKPLNLTLYNQVIELANKKFVAKTGVYRSSWIVNTYKKLGGKYKKSKNSKKGRLSKLEQWYKEKWDFY